MLEGNNAAMNKNWKKNIVLFIASQNISLFGSVLVQYAITWYITLETQSGTMMTISIICGFLPTFFLSPFAGVWADRYNRKLLIALADSMIAIATLILALLFFMGYNSVWLIFSVSAIRALGTGIQTPVVSAFLPQLVPVDKLTKVNATNSSIQSLVTLVSPMLSGVLLTMASIETIFFIDVITALIAVLILLLFLDVPVHTKALQRPTTSYLGDMKAGFNYISKHGFIKKLFLFMGIFFILVAPLSFLTPLQVTRSFGNDVWRLSAVQITYSLGMMLGGIIMSNWSGFANKIHTMSCTFFVVGVCTFLLGIIPVFWVYLLLMALNGLVLPIFNVPFTVLLQQKVEEDYLGRVFGVLGMISSIIMPLAMLLYGPLADLIKIEWLLMGSGVLIFTESLFLFGNKVLIEAGKPMTKPEV